MNEKVITEKDIQNAIDEYLKNVPLIFDKYIKRAQKPYDERMMFCIFTEEHVKYMMINKFDLEKFSIRLLRRLPIYLLKQFEVQVEIDSLWYWALTHDVVSRAYDFINKWPLRDEFLVFMAAHFAKIGAPRDFSLGPPSSESASVQLNQIIQMVVSQPVKEIVSHKDVIIKYLCYPILENLVKFAMSPLIDINGKVKMIFSDGQKQCDPGRRISSLAILLRSLEINAATHLSNPELGTNLKDFRIQTETLIPKRNKGDDGWDSIYKLRNVYLHGVGGWELRTSLLTNLICMILWHLIEDKETTKKLLDIANRPKSWRFPNCYYPPRDYDWIRTHSRTRA